MKVFPVLFIVIIIFSLSLMSCLPTMKPNSDLYTNQVSPRDGMTMIYVPKGEFVMGANSTDKLAFESDIPKHTIWLDAYWIDRTEVSNDQYAKCVSSGICKTPLKNESYTRSIYFGNSLYGNYPIIYVSWNDAKTYCEWAGRRLPTEAEWEKAARGTDERAYPWGNDNVAGSLLNFADKILTNFEWSEKNIDDGFVDTAPVDSYPKGASPYGVLNMAGNVAEWVADWFDREYYKHSPATNPSGPFFLFFPLNGRVYRGGSWDSDKISTRVSARSWYSPGTQSDDIGIRCAASTDLH